MTGSTSAFDPDSDEPVGNRWFGPPWPSADRRAMICEDDRLKIPTPVGSRCYLCGHPITDDDNGVEMPYWDGTKPEMLYQHRECGLRTVIGCSAALRGQPHDHSGDYRQDALKVEAWLYEHGR